MKSKSLRDKIVKTKVVITDVDGVLTDGGIYYSEEGDELKKFNIRDGVGVALLKFAGLKVGAITGESTELIMKRMKKIGMDFVYTGISDKLVSLHQHLDSNGLHPYEVAYVGDELNDHCLLGHVGIFFTVPDANRLIRQRADLILSVCGGQGVLRSVAEIILDDRGLLNAAVEAYLASKLST